MNKSQLYIVANRGKIRAFRPISSEPLDDSSPVHLSELKLSAEEANPKAPDTPEDTDAPGRFGKGGRTGQGGDLAHGEDHALDSERAKRQARTIAEKIGGIVKREEVKSWSFIIPSMWANQIASHFSADVAGSLSSVEHGDWTGKPQAKIEKLLL